MRSVLLLILSLCAYLVPGCASRGEHFQPAMAAPEQAVIYIFRTSNNHLRKSPIQLFVNQEEVGEIYAGQYLAHVVAPGEYLVRAESNTSMVRSVKMHAGDVVYFQITTGALDNKPVIELPEPELARRLIAGTRQAPQ